ncbi:MAG: MFS transporter [candidate division WOR-3 bacterium]|nr:MFS transporter [candidate division WOR-3 bacterium]
MLKLLKIKNFLFLTLSSTLSQFGDRLTHMLLITLVAEISKGKVFTYSQASLTFTLPVLILSPFCGVLVERWEKKKVMFFAHSLQFFLLILTPILIVLLKTFYVIFFSLFLFFLIDLFNNTAKPSLLPSLVEKEDLLVANSLDQSFIRIATVLGMVVGGFLIKWVGWQIGFIINAFTHLGAGLLVMGISYYEIKKGFLKREESLLILIKNSFKIFYNDLKELFFYMRKSKIVLFVLFSIFLTTAIASISYTILIYLIQQVLNLGTSGVGIFAGILAIGMISGALILGFFKNVRNKKNLIIFGIFILGFFFMIGIYFIKPLFMTIIGLIAGITFSIILISQNTILQEEVEKDIRARIFSTKEFITNASFIFTSLSIGLLSDLTSYKFMLFILGIFLMTIAIFLKILIK